jgi:hypothetical protein
MKIRFNMEIKGCQWYEGYKLCCCPYFNGTWDACYCKSNGHIDKRQRKLPIKLNPSWCPMMKGGK